ncbi:MAG: hypothetical protein WA061_02885 [Microgenomates group bacterium]
MEKLLDKITEYGRIFGMSKVRVVLYTDGSGRIEYSESHNPELVKKIYSFCDELDLMSSNPYKVAQKIGFLKVNEGF